jgi:hypothetical protein
MQSVTDAATALRSAGAKGSPRGFVHDRWCERKGTLRPWRVSWGEAAARLPKMLPS